MSERFKKVQVEIEIESNQEVVGNPERRSSGANTDGTGYVEFIVLTKTAKPFIINGVPSYWPDWLTCDWVAKDEDGGLYLHKSEPQRESDGWFCTNGVHYLDKSLIAIDIPGPWEQSLRENPRRKK